MKELNVELKSGLKELKKEAQRFEENQIPIDELFNVESIEKIWETLKDLKWALPLSLKKKIPKPKFPEFDKQLKKFFYERKDYFTEKLQSFILKKENNLVLS